MNKQIVHNLVGSYLATSVSKNSYFDKEYFSTFRDIKSGVEGYTKKLENIFLVVFKASNEPIDWPTNFEFFSKKSYLYGDPKSTKVRIHDAYARGYLKVKEEIQKAFLQSKCDEVCVLGYSMGGGLAPIAALDLQYNNNLAEDKVGCGHSGPRVFNNYGRDSYNRRVPCTIRYKYGNDIVTKVPFEWMNFFHVGEYHHVGPKEKWFKFSFLDHGQYNKIAQYASEQGV